MEIVLTHPTILIEWNVFVILTGQEWHLIKKDRFRILLLFSNLFGIKIQSYYTLSSFKCFKGHIVTKKLTNVVMVTLVQIVKDQNAIHTLNVTTVFVKMSKY